MFLIVAFSRFIGVGLAADIPDSRTVWAFRNALKAHALMHSTTPANAHDNTEFNTILRSAQEGGAEVYADSACRSDANEAELRPSKHSSQINEQAYTGVPLTEAQIACNKVKSQTRARVEHVFGYQENSMGGMGVRSIGLARAKMGNALRNLTYNLCRVEILMRQKAVSFVRFATPKMGLVT